VAPQLVILDRFAPLTIEESVMGKPEKANLLAKDKEYVKYVQLLRRAEMDGRLDGKYTCKLCGMKFHTMEQANACCKIPVA